MTQPNIILIVSDQHRGDWMGCSGSSIVDTPNMDLMARDGVHFTNTYCNSPLCVPSRMSMMTGRHPHHTGVFHNSDHLSSDIPTFAHAMALGGYETVLCGRMHFVGPDQRHGYGKRLVGDITPSYLGGPSTPYGDLAGTAGQGLKSIEKAGPGTSPVLEFDEEVVSACERFLDSRGEESGSPLFLTVGFYGPHHPYVCPPEFFERAMAAMEREGDTPVPKLQGPMHPWLSDWFSRLHADHISFEQLKIARACYAGLVSLTDVYVGRILKAAKQLEGDTIVIYVSDHGDMAGDRGMFWKRSFFEGALRVPMIWYPLQQREKQAVIAQGRKVHLPVSLIDLAPTLTQLGDAPSLPNTDGDNLTPLMSPNLQVDQSVWQTRPIFSESANEQDSVIRTVIHNGMKLIKYFGHKEVMLFDLNRDPQELMDVSEDTNYQDVLAELMSLVMKDWDPEEILASVNAKSTDHNYLADWGKKVGMGRLDLWIK